MRKAAVLFCAYLGDKEGEPAWRETANRHAAWLGLTAYLHSRPVAGGRVFSFGWVSPHPPDAGDLVHETEEHVTLTTLPVLDQPHGPFTAPRNFETNAIRMEVSLLDGSVRAAVPMVSQEQFFYARDARGYAFSNDMRLLVRWAGLELDERGVYSLFQYDIIPPTLTISKKVLRIPGGHLFTLPPGADEPVLDAFFQPTEVSREDSASATPEMQLQETLDGILPHVPKSSVLLFSGGLDSGLLAARLAALGRKDVTLLNFAPHPQDSEGQMALRMAAHLGMTCQQILWSPSAMPSILENLGKDYALPFGDPAVLPTGMLIHALPEGSERPPMVIDGNGSYAGFAATVFQGYYRRVYSIPRPIRWLAAVAYQRLSLWKKNTRESRFAGAIHQSAHMPLPRAAALVHDGSEGIFFTTLAEAGKELERTIRKWVETISEGWSEADQIAHWLWLRDETGLSATKTFDPLRRRGIESSSPLMEPAMLRLQNSLSWDEKCPGGEYRGPLNHLLARSVPREWVYRHRRGFLLPFDRAFSDQAMQAFVREVVLVQDNPLLDFCHKKTVREIVRRAETGQPLSTGARRFLWTFVFASGWLSQLTAAL